MVTIDGKQIKLQIWDTVSREISAFCIFMPYEITVAVLCFLKIDFNMTNFFCYFTLL